MDSYTIYEDLSIRWDKNPAPVQQGKVLYHIETQALNVDSVLGSAQSPHQYRIFDAEKKATQISFGNFFVEGQILEEQEHGIYRVLKFNIVDSNGDKEARSITFTGAHDGGFVLKVPAIIQELKSLQIYGSWKNKTLITELQNENQSLKTTNENLQSQLSQAQAQIQALQNQIAQLQSLAQNTPDLPSELDIPKTGFDLSKS